MSHYLNYSVQRVLLVTLVGAFFCTVLADESKDGIKKGKSFSFKSFAPMADGGSLYGVFESRSPNDNNKTDTVNVVVVRYPWPNQKHTIGWGIYARSWTEGQSEAPFREILPDTKEELEVLEFLRDVCEGDALALRNTRLAWMTLAICDRRVLWYESVISSIRELKKKNQSK